MYQVLAVRSPVCLLPLLEVFDLSPSVVISLYYIECNISIDRIDNIECDISFILYIAFNRHAWYNKATLGGGTALHPAPQTDEKVI